MEESFKAWDPNEDPGCGENCDVLARGGYMGRNKVTPICGRDVIRLVESLRLEERRRAWVIAVIWKHIPADALQIFHAQMIDQGTTTPCKNA
jgi:hypothetical protein